LLAAASALFLPAGRSMLRLGAGARRTSGRAGLASMDAAARLALLLLLLASKVFDELLQRG
jgi:hypothetical protein